MPLIKTTIGLLKGLVIRNSLTSVETEQSVPSHSGIFKNTYIRTHIRYLMDVIELAFTFAHCAVNVLVWCI